MSIIKVENLCKDYKFNVKNKDKVFFIICLMVIQNVLMHEESVKDMIPNEVEIGAIYRTLLKYIRFLLNLEMDNSFQKKLIK